MKISRCSSLSSHIERLWLKGYLLRLYNLIRDFLPANKYVIDGLVVKVLHPGGISNMLRTMGEGPRPLDPPRCRPSPKAELVFAFVAA